MCCTRIWHHALWQTQADRRVGCRDGASATQCEKEPFECAHAERNCTKSMKEWEGERGIPRYFSAEATLGSDLRSHAAGFLIPHEPRLDLKATDPAISAR